MALNPASTKASSILNPCAWSTVQPSTFPPNTMVLDSNALRPIFRRSMPRLQGLAILNGVAVTRQSLPSRWEYDFCASMMSLIPHHFSSKTIGIFAGLACANLGAWAWAIAAFHNYPVLLGTALLAYGFGLRHAVDADHIAAIDNVTRKLMQQGKRPVAVGFFFSLGHSTIVFGLSVAIALRSEEHT